MKTIQLFLIFIFTGIAMNALAQPVVSGTVTDASCISCPDGSIDLTVTGSNPPFMYLWSTGATVEDLVNILPGPYWVTVTDAMMMTDTSMFNVMEMSSGCMLSAFFNSSIMNTYPDSVVYEFIDMSTGGTIGSYFWDFGDGYYSNVANPNHAFTADGLYTVQLTISDPMMTCSDIHSEQINIDVPNDSSGGCMASFSTSSIAATGSSKNDGFIDAYFSMGQPPLFFVLKTIVGFPLDSSGGTDMFMWTFDSIFPGPYIVHAWDLNGCNFIDTVLVASDSCSGFYAGSDSSANASGPGMSDGLIRMYTTGGTAPFSYFWSNGQTTQMAVGLGAGQHSVTVIDANGCAFYTNYFIYEDGCMDRYFNYSDNYINNPSPYSNDGSIRIDSIAGSPKPYSLYWDDMSTANPRENLTAGIYYVTITDADGCHIFTNIELYTDFDSCNVVANFSFSPMQTFPDSVIYIFNNMSTGNFNATMWNSGDWNSYNQNSYTTNTVFTYYRDGFYDVNMVIWDSLGYCYANITKTVNVDIPNDTSVICNANFSYTVVDDEVTLTNMSAGPGGTVYSWDFGDGTYSTVPDPAHIYAKDGYYSIWLLIYDTVSGCMDNLWQNVYIDSPSDSTVSCFADFTTVINGMSVDFNLTASGNVLYAWNFGDGQTSTFATPSHTYDYPGYYYVYLTTYDTITGCVASAWKDIAIINPNDTIQPVNALFSYFIEPGTTRVSFTDNSIGNATNWYWTFGDGTFAEDKNPVKNYSSAGMYTVCMYIYDSITWVMSSECKDLSVGSLTCNVKAGFSSFINQANNSIAITNQSLGSNNSYFWNFGDGFSSTDVNPTYIYSRPGFYMISLSVYDTTNFCTDYAYEFIQVGTSNCKADFEFSINTSTKTVNYTNKSNGAGFSYWFFDDGDYSYDKNPVKTYAWGGRHFTWLTIADSMGMCYDYIEKELQVGIIECSAEFTYHINPATKTMYLTSNAIGDSLFYYWIFGDGESSMEKNPVHTFSYDGLYTIYLSVYNMLTGCLDYAEQTVLVGSMGNDCEADFIYMAENETTKVKFTNKSLCNSTQYQWQFGDTSAVSTDENPEHTYADGGYYNVCLWTKNAAGIENLTCKEIKVNPPANLDCYADFSFIVDSLTKKASFTDKSYGNPTGWKWYFGDGDSASTANPVHTYTNRDYYIVQLNITNAAGCTSTTYQIVNAGTLDSLHGQFAYEKGPARKASGYPVDFVGIAHGDAAKLRWSFGDGTYDSVSNSPTHYYATTGNYNVCLTVEDPITLEKSTSCQIVRVGNTTEVVEYTSGISATLLNYPNPSKSITNIIYSIKTDGLVELAIYNTNGTKVISLINTVKKAGSYNLAFDVSNLTNGLYLLQLRTADGIVTNKMIVE